MEGRGGGRAGYGEEESRHGTGGSLSLAVGRHDCQAENDGQAAHDEGANSSFLLRSAVKLFQPRGGMNPLYIGSGITMKLKTAFHLKHSIPLLLDPDPQSLKSLMLESRYRELPITSILQTNIIPDGENLPGFQRCSEMHQSDALQVEGRCRNLLGQVQ